MKASELYLGSKTNRYHTDPILNQVIQTNADHSWGVAMIIYYLVKKPSAELIKAAIFHDGAEFIVGDFPNPFKRRYPDFKADHKKIENQELLNLGVNISLSGEDQKILKVADSLEAIAFVKLHRPDYIRERDDWKSHVSNTLKCAEDLDPKIFNKVITFLQGIDPLIYKKNGD